MFERFTDRARRVVVLAQEEARLLNHDWIGTEHVLLGLLHDGEGVAAAALVAMDISLAAVRREVEEIIGRGEAAPVGHIAFTPRAKKVLELSLRESLQMRRNYIGTEHILLGLIREGDGVAAQVLVRLGANLSRVRDQVIQLLHGPDTITADAGSPRLDDPAGRERRGPLLADVLRRLRLIESRLDVLEGHAGGIGSDVREINAEIGRLRGLLRQHGIDPEDGTA